MGCVHLGKHSIDPQAKVSSIGNNKAEVVHHLRTGTSGIRKAEELQKGGFRSQIWGDIRGDFRSLLDRKMARFMNEAAVYAWIAMQEAIEDARLSAQRIAQSDVGLIVGSGGGSMSNPAQAAEAFAKKGVRGVGPYMVPRTMCSGIAACLSTYAGIRGVSYALSSACSTSAHCIGHASELIQLGKQSIVFAGGADEVHPLITMQFDAMGALASRHNDDPTKASRPYDQARDGFVISGGAGIVVLEEKEHAETRGATIYGELVGYGATSDGYDMVAPSGEGAQRCMEASMKDVTGSIDYLNTHGTSTLMGDARELEAVARAFGNKKLPYISSTKSMTGHALGAAGAHEVIYSLLMLQGQFVAPSINIEQIDPFAERFPIVREPLSVPLRTVMSNSFGFGGTNACLIFQKSVV